MPINRHPYLRDSHYPVHADEVTYRHGHTDSLAAFKEALRKEDEKRAARVQNHRHSYLSHYNNGTGNMDHLTLDQQAMLMQNYGVDTDYKTAMAGRRLNQKRTDSMAAYAASTEPYQAFKPPTIGVNYEKKQDDSEMAHLIAKHEREELKDIKMHGRRIADEYQRHSKTIHQMDHQAVSQVEAKYSHEVARLAATEATSGVAIDKKAVAKLKSEYKQGMIDADTARHDRELIFMGQEKEHAAVFSKVEKASHESHVQEENCLDLFTKHKQETFEKMFDEHKINVGSVDPILKPRAPKGPRKAKAHSTTTDSSSGSSNCGTSSTTAKKTKASGQHSNDYLAGIVQGALMAGKQCV